MIVRFVSGIIGIPLLIILVFVQKGLPFILGVGLLSVIGLNEFYRGVRKTGAAPQEWLGLVSAVLFMFAARDQFRPAGVDMPAALTMLVLTSLTIELFRVDRSPIKNMGATFLGVVYVGWLFSYLVALRSVGHGTTIHFLSREFHISLGAWYVLYVVFCAWAADTGAYLVGRKWGKHKLAPTISPGKSWEGVIAGVVSCIAMSALMGGLIQMAWVHIVVIGFGVAIAGPIGDLAESSMKRDIGIKDFGSILPGHGGILDRFDGLLFAAPLFYYYVTLVVRF